METKVILVNEQDEAMGEGEKLQVHQQGLLHRAFSVFIYRLRDHKIEVLLQKRHPAKYHSGGLWTNACCSHPYPGELTQVAAERRLFEELGIKISLTKIGQFEYRAKVGNDLIEHEFDHVFIGEMTHQIIKIHPDEATDIAWLDVETLSAELKNHPAEYTAWLPEAFEIVCRYFNHC